MMADVDAVIVGAGAVGLAIGRSLAVRGLSVIVLEKHAGFGEETSSRNSEVVHAGMYYPTGTLKARLCVAGARAIYEYCTPRGIAATPIGKLIVAPDANDVGPLEDLLARGNANGVEGMMMIDARAIKAREPEIDAQAAIYSPVSGIFDSHSYMLALLGDIEDHGGALARSTPFEGASYKGGAWHVRTGGAAPTTVSATHLILSAGLWSTHAAKRVEGLDMDHIPETFYARGNYFRYGGKAPFKHLIYPMPGATGLGIHVTPDMSGHARFGPDVQFIEAIDYRVDESRKQAFVDSIKAYWPSLDPDLLHPDYSGIRPKIGNAVKGFEDFKISGPEVHGLEGLITLFGIDSPGLTSSFAIGGYVADMIAPVRATLDQCESH
jgi:L-2-hydroxyglutarate oxidase LhgO